MQNSISQQVRVRIAPSPTGRLHIGTARTALFNYLFAKRNGGTFILRIEDTDAQRSKKEFEDEIVSYLQWLGMAWDEGVLPGGKSIGAHGPYRSSERMALYRPYIEQLLQEGKAFYCFMTEIELDEARKKADADGTAFLMRSPWRDTPLAEARKKVAAGAEYVIRFRVPSGRETIAFDDSIRGGTAISADVIEDFAIAKNADAALYNFAVAIDDHVMQISHVIRGEDHISNTPKQLLLYEALGWHPPIFAHLPLILGPDRSKLSKRHGATSVADFEAQGFLPEALVNFMALLGWNPGNERELYTLSELEKEFSLERVQKSGAIFNQEKLDWLNGMYIRMQAGEGEALLEKVKPFIAKAGYADAFAAYHGQKQIAMLVLAAERMKKLSDAVELSEFFFKEPAHDPDLLRWKSMEPREVAQSLEKSFKALEELPEGGFNKQAIDIVLKKRAEEAGDNGSIFWPLRVALTGRKASPPPAPIMEILGKQKALQRIQTAAGSIKD